MCPHDYDTVVIMFYSFCFNQVPSKTFRIAYSDSCVDPAENQKRAPDLILFALDWYTNFLGLPNLVEFLEFQKYTFNTDYYRLFCF